MSRNAPRRSPGSMTRPAIPVFRPGKVREAALSPVDGAKIRWRFCLKKMDFTVFYDCFWTGEQDKEAFYISNLQPFTISSQALRIYLKNAFIITRVRYKNAGKRLKSRAKPPKMPGKHTLKWYRKCQICFCQVDLNL